MKTEWQIGINTDIESLRKDMQMNCQPTRFRVKTAGSRAPDPQQYWCSETLHSKTLETGELTSTRCGKGTSSSSSAFGFHSLNLPIDSRMLFTILLASFMPFHRWSDTAL